MWRAYTKADRWCDWVLFENSNDTVSSLQCPPFVRCNVQRSFANPEKHHFFSLLFKSKQTHRSLFIVHRSSFITMQYPTNHRTATTIKQQSSRYVQSCQLLNRFSRPADHAAQSNRPGHGAAPIRFRLGFLSERHCPPLNQHSTAVDSGTIEQQRHKHGKQ
jgi:hypothetical protein